ncbi:MAG: flavoprotein [Bacteroidetes bacterium]|nr:flavoprotein [Bacteroidota bacterium]
MPVLKKSVRADLKKSISIVGGGSCALMLACALDTNKFDVSVYEKNATPGRKFLVAGDGGLNLTHSENKNQFIKRFTPFAFIEKAFNNYGNDEFVRWINSLDIPTYTGSSGRIFPEKKIKPAEVLNAILKKLKSNSVKIYNKHEWKGFSENDDLLFTHLENNLINKSDYVVFCLGGSSWKVTGSDGSWKDLFERKGIKINPFMPSNCAFKIEWNKDFILKANGKVLKNISITCGNKTHPGEVVITNFGMEGSGIYPLSPQIREGLSTEGISEISLDLKPSLSLVKIIEKIKMHLSRKNISDILKSELNFTQVHIQLLKAFISKEDFTNVEKLSFHIKNFKISIQGMAPLDDAISTVGGISLSEINGNFELLKMPKCFAIGEMLDYDAPTGGYLLQSCYTMSNHLASHLNKEVK